MEYGQSACESNILEFLDEYDRYLKTGYGRFFRVNLYVLDAKFQLLIGKSQRKDFENRASVLVYAYSIQIRSSSVFSGRTTSSIQWATFMSSFFP